MPYETAGLSKENEKYLNVLFMTDPSDDMEAIEQNNGELLEGSGSWLQMDTNYRAWFDHTGTKVLWIHGDPGKGKTMLAISVVKTLLERMKFDSSASEICFAYYFCDNKDNRRNSSLAILRSLIYQIIHQRPDLCFRFRTVYEREGDQLFTSENGVQSLWSILRKLLSSPSLQKVYIIIDALDESEEQSTKDLLNLLKPFLNPELDIHDDQTTLKEETSCGVKWLLTSRNIDFISRSLRGALNVSLETNANLVQDSVWKFIDQRVDQLQRLKAYDAALTELVRCTFREKSQGTFLYVSLACRELSQSGVDLTNTESVLERLPQGLLPLYQRIMTQINPTEDLKLAAHTKAMLRAMVLALRPLTIQELAIAANLPHDDVDILNEYVASCGSFITRRQDKVHFVHESVKTYLRSIDEVFSASVDIYHAELTRSFLNHVGELKDNRSDVAEAATLLGYPTSFWIYHARQSGHYMTWEATLHSELFSSVSQSRQKWLDLYWVTNHQEWEKQPADFTPLHLAAYGGISSLVSALLARGDAVDEADSNGNTALIWAAKNGHGDVVRILLENDADCEAKTIDGLTALLWATINSHQRVVQELIKYRASVRVTDSMGWTPLHHAASHGHSHVLADLLAAGAAIDAKDICQESALQRATFCVDLAIIKILVEKGADIRVKDKDGLTLLHLAAGDGHLDLVDFWLTHSGDLETKDDQGWTPLMHAAWFGHHNITAYLIQNGAKLETRSLDGNTSLHLATWKCHARVVKVLLDAKADPNSECDRKETPLQQAASLGHAVVCQLLLESGVDPNAKSDSGATPLHQAAANGHEVVSRLLLDFGGDPNTIDKSEQTPGARAEENNHLILAKLLKSFEIRGDEEDLDTGQDEAPGEFEELDPAVCQLLKVPLESCIGQPHGKPGFSKPTKVTALVNGKARHFFMKSGPIGEMFASMQSSRPV
jgi:ankyrin repeat protein